MARTSPALPSLAWLGYLSTTGVYGDRGGGWVDESSAFVADRRARAAPGRGRARLARSLRRLPACRCTSSVWRRSTAPAAARSTRCGPAPPNASTSRARSFRAFMSRTLRVCCAPRSPGRVRVRSTMSATTTRRRRRRSWPMRQSCSAIAAPPLVPLEEAGLSPMARSFYDDNKRVRNALIKSELGVSVALSGLPGRACRDPRRGDGLRLAEAAGLRHGRANSAVSRRSCVVGRKGHDDIQRIDDGRVLRVAAGDQAAVRRPQDHHGMPAGRGRGVQQRGRARAHADPRPQGAGRARTRANCRAACARPGRATSTPRITISSCWRCRSRNTARPACANCSTRWPRRGCRACRS